MLILPDYLQAYMIEAATSPVIPRHNWYFDAPAMDFMLKPILFLEETLGEAVLARINGYEFLIPSAWHILVVDEETRLVDTVPIKKSVKFQAFLMHPGTSSFEASEIVLIDLNPMAKCTHTSIPKGCMLCHPVGPVTPKGDSGRPPARSLPIWSCLIGPQDLHKHLNDVTAKELLI